MEAGLLDGEEREDGGGVYMSRVDAAWPFCRGVLQMSFE